MTLKEFISRADEVDGLGKDALLVRYKGDWYVVDLEKRTVVKVNCEEDLRILVGGV
jgi:hypothetical protein